MTVQTYDIAGTRNGLVNRAFDWVGDRLTAMGEARARAAMTRELLRLDERTLRDIGFSRSEITSLVANPADASRIRR